MAKLLKQAKAKSLSINYHVDLFEEEDGKFATYANNDKFNWGHIRFFLTREEAEKDFDDFLKLFDHYDWKVEEK